MKCSIFIATSVDGFIAKTDGSVDWLHTAGNPDADMGDQADMGFNDYISSIDCMIMGRKCMDTISAMNLTPEQWPYGDRRIIVLSNTIKQAPANLKGKVEMYSGDLLELISILDRDGFKHAYIDGGTTIQNFIELQLISEMTITKAPILLGAGVPLFGKMGNDLKLVQGEAIVFPNDFIQLRYTLEYK